MEDENIPIINKDSLYCQKCQTLQVFNLFNDNNKIYINLTCKCFHKKALPFSDYINSLQTEKPKQPIHIKQNKKQFYCKDCKTYYDNNDKDNSHYLHNVLDLSDMKPEVIKFSSNLELSKNYLYNVIRKVKDKLINRLQNEISIIQQNYDKCVKRNNNLISLLKCIVDNFYSNINTKDYNLLVNINNNNHFNFHMSYSSNKQISEQINEMNSFLDNYTIIKIPYKNCCLITENVIKTNNQFSITSSMLVLNNKLLLSNGAFIIMYLINNGYFKYINELHLSKENITCLCRYKDNIFLASANRLIFVVDCESDNEYNVLYSFEAHNLAINRLIPIRKAIIASCCIDGDIKVWDINSKKNIFHFIQTKMVNSFLYIQKKNMISFSTEDHINFLNFSDNNRDKNLIKQISIKGYKSMILIKDNKILFSVKNSQLNIINVDNFTIETTIILSTTLKFEVNFTLFNNDYIICYDRNNNGSYLSRLNLRDLTIKEFFPKDNCFRIDCYDNRLYCMSSTEIKIKNGNIISL